MNRDVLEEMLNEHERWLLSDGKEGHQLKLPGEDLSGMDFSGMNLSGANFSSAGLGWANFRGANLFDANLYCANLTGADLFEANLTGAQISGANFTDAKLPPSIRHCWNIHHATFPADALPWLILHPKWSDCKDTVRIVNT
jgi:hypothetical protein